MNVPELLLKRRGLVYVDAESNALHDPLIRAVEVDLAQLGYSLSSGLQKRLQTLPAERLKGIHQWIVQTLSSVVGADRKYVPLFRNFPNDIPTNTFDLWLKKVGIYYFQAPDQPCLFCKRTGTTHVLNPCAHVVCDHCFDGSNYTACPACEHHVDTVSPFFKHTLTREEQLRFDTERVRFKILDIGVDRDQDVRSLFESLCVRKQVLSPDDTVALATIVQEYGLRVLPWLPEIIAVKENVAIVVGKLAQQAGFIPDAAQKYLRTATDVLRFIAAYSDADPSLIPVAAFKNVVGPLSKAEKAASVNRAPPQPPTFLERLRGWTSDPAQPGTRTKLILCKRFKVARLKRPLRRSLLEKLESFPFESLMDDMLRHASYWVWIGEFLHPFEYAKRYPHVAVAFAVVRKQKENATYILETAKEVGIQSVDHLQRLVYQSYSSRLEAAAKAGQVDTLVQLLAQRPGELVRRLDWVMRLALNQNASPQALIDLFLKKLPSMATPALTALSTYLPRRAEPLPTRLYLPKSKVVTGVLAPDRRRALAPDLTKPLVKSIQQELVNRLQAKPRFSQSILDSELTRITVPFNERTASPAAVSLPRGSSLPVPTGKWIRLFLHWCQKPGTEETDLDLSVGFYDSNWEYKGVCSYYELTFENGKGQSVAKSAGDLRDAPFPAGASEFIDLDVARAAENNIRYAVMVVNNYSGEAFGSLERAFAGLMFRDDPMGPHFDPRTVELKFNLQGNNGVFLPLVLDLERHELHWLDAYSKGQFKFNNVSTSTRDIQRIGPGFINYFASGVRPSMYQLAAMHAASRSDAVWVRNQTFSLFKRGSGESALDFYHRILNGKADQTQENQPTLTESTFAALVWGDISLPKDSQGYALFRQETGYTLAASDLFS